MTNDERSPNGERPNPKPEGRSPKEFRRSKPESPRALPGPSVFAFRCSGFFRISSFGFRHSRLVLLQKPGIVARVNGIMTKPVFSGPPSPEEFQRQLSEFVRQQFQHARGPAPAPAESAEPPESGESKGKGGGFEFDYKPRAVKEHLDRFVIKQDEAKKVLSVALCDHYHHVRLAMEGKDQPNYQKQNVLLMGPTGVGKTYLIRSMAELVGVPFVKADATK